MIVVAEELGYACAPTPLQSTWAAGLLGADISAGRGALVDQTHDGKKVGKHGLPGVNSQLAFNDYERIMGHEKVDDEWRLPRFNTLLVELHGEAVAFAFFGPP